MADKKDNDKIKKDMPLGEVIQKYPQTFEVFSKYGLHCIGCAVSAFETIEQGAMAHGINAEELVKDLNKALKKEKKEG